MIPPQYTTTTATLNTTAQTQNTTILPNIFNLTSQPMGMITEAMAGRSNSQNNTISNVNTGGEHFPHFRTVGANPFGGFGAFGNNNPPSENNNNNNLPPPLPPFGGDLGGGFNPLPRGNAGGLDPNVAAVAKPVLKYCGIAR